MTVPAEVEALIQGAPVSAHLATTVDGRPHVAPVWYGYRDGVVSCLTGGRKLENVRRNPRVALSIEAVSDGGVDWNVTLLGRATVIDDPERVESAGDWIYEAYDDEGADVGGRTDGGVEPDYALVEIAVGSASYDVYG